MTLVEYARKLRPLIEKAAAGLSDSEALEGASLFPKWSAGVHYAKGMRAQFEGTLYKCLQEHDSQETWNPRDAVSLWAEVLIPNENEVPEWKQPESTNPYKKGDKVKHNGFVWESLIDSNVWEPGTVGTESLWKKVEAAQQVSQSAREPIAAS